MFIFVFIATRLPCVQYLFIYSLHVTTITWKMKMDWQHDKSERVFETLYSAFGKCGSTDKFTFNEPSHNEWMFSFLITQFSFELYSHENHLRGTTFYFIFLNENGIFYWTTLMEKPGHKLGPWINRLMALTCW
jgi:hypothetical protein